MGAVIFLAAAAYAHAATNPIANANTAGAETLRLALVDAPGGDRIGGDFQRAGTHTYNSSGVIRAALPAYIPMTNTTMDGGLGGYAQGAVMLDESGYAISGAGDVNGDGFEDVLIGARWADPQGVDEAGETYLVYGRESGLPSSFILTNTWLNGSNGVILQGCAPEIDSGLSVSGAGDVNGDGLADFLIGAPSARPNSLNWAGETYLVYGATNLPATILLTKTWLDGVNGLIFQGAGVDWLSGHSVSGAGDVNGDGLMDILIGARGAYLHGEMAAGETYLVYGAANLPAAVMLTNTWLNGTNGVLFAGAVAGDQSGYAVSGAGDVNGDGLQDILIGVNCASPRGENQAGTVCLIYGATNLPAAVVLTNAWLDGVNGAQFEGALAQDHAGSAVGPAGDVNCDGLADFLVGALAASPRAANAAGETYLVFGQTNLPGQAVFNSAWLDGTNGVTFQGAFAGDASGNAVNGAGDVNDDGFHDLLIGAPGAAGEGGEVGAGEAYLIYGGFSWPATVILTNTWFDGVRGVLMRGTAENECWGESVDGAGDVNGDCYADFLVGAYIANPRGVVAAGETALFYGSSDGVAPSFGPWTGGFPVVISGSSLGDGSDITNVTLCGVAATISSQAVNAVWVLAGSATGYLPGDVRVFSTSYGETVRSNAFTYDASGILISGPAFGHVRVGDSAVNIFTLTNSGNLVLQISGWTNDGPGAAFFDVALPDALDAGASSNFLVAFTPGEGGLFNPICYTVNDSPYPNYYFGLVGQAYQLTALSGPYNGGNTITVSNGFFGTITNILVGSLSVVPSDSGDNWFTLTLPPATAAGPVDFVVQTSDQGDTILASAYTYNPRGAIGGLEYGPSAWTNLGAGMDQWVFALAHDGQRLYAGGQFTTAGGVPAANIARWDGSAWSDMGGGMDDLVHALLYDGAHLYAGGDFTNAGGVAANYVARWDGSAWTNLGEGVNMSVYALAHDGTNLYAAGVFTNAGGLPAQHVAMWNGSHWTNLGAGVDNDAHALWCDEGRLYVGGVFTNAGGAAARHVAMWDGSAWTNLGGGMDYYVFRLFQMNGLLYAAGNFTTADGATANRIAQWDGNTWTNLGDGFNNQCSALAGDGTNLFAGGFFTNAGAVGVNYVAAWNPAAEAWTNLGSGMNDTTYCLLQVENTLYAGGRLTSAGGVPANYVAQWGPSTIVNPGVSPASGPWTGGFEVVISGANLGDGSDITNVTLCEMEANIQSQDATQVVVVAGSAAAPVLGDVRVFSTSFGETVKSNGFEYLKADQTIDFQDIWPVKFTGTARLRAWADSDLPVLFEVVSGPGYLVVSNRLAFSSVGDVWVKASQEGDANWNPAAAVTNLAKAYAITPERGPFVGGNTVTVSNGYFGAITNIMVGESNALPVASGANWFTLVLPPAGYAGPVDLAVQTSDDGEILLPFAYVYNPAGRINGGGIPSWVTLTNAWLDGTNGIALEGARESDGSGYAVSTAGDVNGDGFNDLLVGALCAGIDEEPGAGETYLVYGRSNSLPTGIVLTNTWLDGTNGVLLAGAVEGDTSGFAVRNAGDVNGDGYADILIGAYLACPGGQLEAGETYLVYGRSNGLPAGITLTNTWLDGTNGVIFAGEGYAINSGFAVSSAGDVNGDGFSDILIGAPMANPAEKMQAGETYLIWGRADGLPAWIDLNEIWLDGSNGVILAGVADDYSSGAALGAAGDVNGDGLDDLLIGAFSAQTNAAGETYLIYGRTNGLPPMIMLDTNWLDGTNGVLLTGAHDNDNSGYSVNSAGDVNSDGFDDFLVGALSAAPGGLEYAGETYLVYGRNNGLPASITLDNTWLDGTNGVLFAGANEDCNSGVSVSSAGDVNNDGYDDILIGAINSSPYWRTYAGETYLVYGRSNGLPAQITLDGAWLDREHGAVLAGGMAMAFCGISVNPAGDMNGDGFADFLVGAYGASPDWRMAAGETYLIYGRALLPPLEPAAGVASGGYPVLIRGENLGDGADITNVTLCGIQATIQSQTVECIWVTAGQTLLPGPGDVRVYSISYGETLRTNAFTYIAEPTLAIQSPYGVGTPPVGVYTNPMGATLTNRMTATDTQGVTQYVCAGWTMAGHEPGAGSGIEFEMTVTNDAILTWLWTTNYYLTPTAGLHGTVDRIAGWFTNGEEVAIGALPDPYYFFTNWTGDASGNTNPLHLVMDAPKWVTANFAAIWTTNRPTPYWWMAQYGITDRFEEAVFEDPDGDWVPTSDEFMMNTDPTNGQSYLYALPFGLVYGTNCFDVVVTNSEPPYEVMTSSVCDVVGDLLAWPCATDRVYDVHYGPACGTWFPADGFSNLTANSGWLVITNLATVETQRFYRLKVRLP